jgi:hypothetical protein
MVGSEKGDWLEFPHSQAIQNPANLQAEIRACPLFSSREDFHHPRGWIAHVSCH